MLQRLRDPTVQGLAIAALALLLALCGVSWLAITSSGHLLFPELARKALAEAEQTRGKIDRALELGIPIDRLVGVDAVYAGMTKSDADIGFLAVTDLSHRALFLHGVTASGFAQVLAGLEQIPAPEGLADCQSLRAGYLVTALPLRSGVMYLGHDERALVRPLVDNLFDIAVVVLVAMLLAFEVMLLVITANVTRPARSAIQNLQSLAEGRPGSPSGQSASGVLGQFVSRLDGFVASVSGGRGTGLPSADTTSVVGVRLLAFLFVFAEELGRPFLPLYVAGFAVRTPGVDPNLATGLLIGLHMCVVAVTMPFATMLYTRLGRVRLYALGALLATAGLIGTALAAGYWDLVVWRALSAVGYGTTFVACQGFVIESSSRDNRATGTAMMVGGITLADICGPAFGGVMAERFGQDVTFLIAAGVAVVASLLVARLMAGGSRLAEAPRHISLRDFAVAFRNRRLVVQVCLAALPAKLLLTGFLFYLVPVVLMDVGQNEADVGRIVMIYGLAMLVGSPLFAHLSDRWNNHAAVVALGGVVSSALLLAVPWVPPDSATLAAIATIAALGAGQSMSITAQVSMVVALAADSEVRQGVAPELTVLRFIERFGGGAGPMIAAPLAAAFDASVAIGLFGLYGLLSAILYAALTVRPSRRRTKTPAEAAP